MYGWGKVGNRGIVFGKDGVRGLVIFRGKGRSSGRVSGWVGVG